MSDVSEAPSPEDEPTAAPMGVVNYIGRTLLALLLVSSLSMSAWYGIDQLISVANGKCIGGVCLQIAPAACSVFE